MNRLAAAGMLLALGLAGCDSLPSLPALGGMQTASLPPDAYNGASDPLRAAVGNAGFAFSSQSQLAGRPVAAARAVAEMEFLKVEVAENPRSAGGSTTASTIFPAAQREWRAALGINPAAPPQAVIDGLFGAARALGVGQQGAAAAALPTAVFTMGPTATLARLAAMPELPVTNQAAQEATRVLRRGGLGRF